MANKNALNITDYNVSTKTICKADKFNLVNEKKGEFERLKKDGKTATIKKGTKIVIKKKAEPVKNPKESNIYYNVVEVGNENDIFWIKATTIKIKGESLPGQKDRVESVGKLSSLLINNGELDGLHVDPSKIFYGSLNGIFGAPYQFMPLADIPPTKGMSFGRTYAERIVAKMPIVIMTPGYPYFLPAFKKADKKNIMNQLAEAATNINNLKSTILNGLLNKDDYETRYYSFHEDISNYFKYVNTMLKYCVIALGIQKYVHRSTVNTSFFGALNITEETNVKNDKGYYDTLLEYRWDRAINRGIKNMLRAGTTNNYIAFYVDSETSVSESLSNGTTTSQLVDQFNQTSSSIKEIKFLAGGLTGFGKAQDEDTYESSKSGLMQAVTKLGGGNNKIFNNIDEAFKTIGKGGRLIFPEIWDDSEFSKSYSFNIRLRTPDADKVSWFLNICVPLIHLLAFAAPRALGVNGYKTPFLVRAYYKGIFNCDMGLITGMSITKGRDSAWTVDGLPTEVDVSVDIKDLYSALSISKANQDITKFIKPKQMFKFIKNTALFDYLSNTCGVNINAPNVTRSMETMYAMQLEGGFSRALQDTFGNIGNYMADSIFNARLNMYDRYFKF